MSADQVACVQRWTDGLLLYSKHLVNGAEPVGHQDVQNNRSEQVGVLSGKSAFEEWHWRKLGDHRFEMKTQEDITLAEIGVAMGRRLREGRTALGLTQAKFALLLGVNESSIKRYESGTSTIPSDVVVLMSRVGIDVGYLFTGRPATSVWQELNESIDINRLSMVVREVDRTCKIDGGDRLSDIERVAEILRGYLRTSMEPHLDRIPFNAIEQAQATAQVDHLTTRRQRRG